MDEGTNNPANLKCPFRATIMTRSFACQHAREVTRREGPDIGCDSGELNQQCQACFSGLKDSALPELGYTDDLTSMPASAIQKIQYGGLLALKSLQGMETGNVSIDDISVLIDNINKHYQGIENVPYAQCVENIKNYKMKRRRGR